MNNLDILGGSSLNKVVSPSINSRALRSNEVIVYITEEFYNNKNRNNYRVQHKSLKSERIEKSKFEIFKERLTRTLEISLAATILASTIVVGKDYISPQNTIEIIDQLPPTSSSPLTFDEMRQDILKKNIEYVDNQVVDPFDDPFGLGNIDERLRSVDNSAGDIYTEKNSEKLEIVKKISNQYGIDYCLFAALLMQESSFGNNKNMNNGNAIGMAQIERCHVNGYVEAFDFNANEIKSVLITEKLVYSLEGNLEVGAMLFQNRLLKYNDLRIAVQAYNYGDYSMNLIIKLYNIMNNNPEDYKPSYVELKPLIDDYCDNPTKYIKGWKYSTYGDKNYADKVLKYFAGKYTCFMTLDGIIKIYDVETGACIGQSQGKLIDIPEQEDYFASLFSK